jgi:signal transduction histidine kinase
VSRPSTPEPHRPRAVHRHPLFGLAQWMTLGRLKWAGVAAALGFIALVELVRTALGPAMVTWQGRLLLDGMIFTAAIFSFGAVYRVVELMQARLERQNRELLTLHAAALDVHSELALEPVLQKVVDQARQLLDARYGALSVIDDQNRIESFVTSGITPEQRARIGPPPTGHGLLGVVLNQGQHLRITDIGSDPRSHGFPDHHPAMHSLLAVPVLCLGPFRGNLYLTEKQGGEQFTPEDEQSLVRFATTAAIAIDNAHLHQQLNSLAVAEERLHIAHEMHDGLAQVLAYVNTKAQAVREFLRTGRTEEAARQLDQLAAAAREVYTDVRESIIGLRTASGDGGHGGDGKLRGSLADAVAQVAAAWEAQSGIACRVAIAGTPRLPAAAELQVLRIVQEALANVRKHGQARQAEVRLEQEPTRLAIAVEDDGVGFDPGELGRSEFPRFGLATMRERAQSIGGVVHLDSAPGRGTRVRIEIPNPA